MFYAGLIAVILSSVGIATFPRNPQRGRALSRVALGIAIVSVIVGIVLLVVLIIPWYNASQLGTSGMLDIMHSGK